MNPHSWSRPTAALLCALFLAACIQGGTDEATPRNIALVDAIANEMVFRSNPVTTEAADAECVGEEIYAALGATRLSELGVTVGNPDPRAPGLTAQERTTVEDLIRQCVGDVAYLAAQARESTDQTTIDAPSSADQAEAENTAAGVPANAEQSERDLEIDQAAESLLSDPDSPTNDPAEARCLAEVLVGVLGIDRFYDFEAAADLTGFTMAEGETYVDATIACVDLEESFLRDLTSGSDALALEDASCLVNRLGSSWVQRSIRAAMVADVTGQPVSIELDAELDQAVNSCL